MKKWWGNGSIVAAGTTAVIVVAAVTVLVRASDLNKEFKPEDYSRFEDLYENAEDYNTVAGEGEGEDSDLADENKEGEESTEGDSQKALKVAEDENELYNSLGLADGGAADGEENLNAFEIGDDDGGGSSLGVTQGGTGSGNGNDGTGSGGGTGSGNGNGGTGSGSGNGETGSGSGNSGNGAGNSGTGAGEGTGPGENEDIIPPYVLTKWDEEQLSSREPVTMEDGSQLIGLEIEFKLGSPSYYYPGDVFKETDAKVEAVLRDKGGNRVTKILKYGGPDGYSISMTTKSQGNFFAVFEYRGFTVRKEYEVRSATAGIRYYSFDRGTVYAHNYPGPLEPADVKEALEEETKEYRSGKGGIIDFSKLHSRLIYILGDSSVGTIFSNDNQYSHVVMLNEKDGYLTNMLCGFHTFRNELGSDSYIYYPIEEDWGSTGVTMGMMDVVDDVPADYLIKRVVQKGDKNSLGTYMGQQVLVGYRGTASTVEVPLGVTHIRLEEKKDTVKILGIPESIMEFSPEDVKALAKYFPNLEKYTVKNAKPIVQASGYFPYKVVDDALYDKDGKTLLSVPPKKEDVKIPDSVTTLREGCFSGLGTDSTIIFQGKTPPADWEGLQGYPGKILVPDSENDLVLKAYALALGKEGIDIDKLGVADKNGKEVSGKSGLYTYKKDKQGNGILVWEKDETKLAAAPMDVSGEYTVTVNDSNSITVIGEGAFGNCTFLNSIWLPDTIEKLEAGSLILPNSVKTITLLSNDVVDIDENLFGESGKVPDIRISVPADLFNTYLTVWGNTLDPIYGEDAAKKLLTKEAVDFLYKDGIQYQKISSGDGKDAYRLQKAYSDKTVYQVMDGVTEIASEAFSGCKSLENLYLPESLKTIEAQAFAGCKSLEVVTTYQKGLVTGESFGTSVPDTVKIFQAGEEFESFSYVDGIIYGKKNGKDTLLNVPTDYGKSLTVLNSTSCLASEALKNCSSVSEISLPVSITEIGDRCFENCGGLSEVNLEMLTNLQLIGEYAFRGCSNLVKLTLPKQIHKIEEGMCCDCILLENVEADWGNIKSVGKRAFYFCGSLSFPTTGMTAIESLGDEAFYGCRAFRSVTLPSTLESMGEACFSDCVGLISVRMNSKIPVLSRYCFYGCRALESVEFAGEQVRSLRLIGAQTFGECSSLVEMDMGGLPGLNQMGEEVFAGCRNLEKVVLPENLQNLPDRCFSDCPALSVLTLTAAETPRLGGQIFGEKEKRSVYVYMLVKEGRLEDYKAAYISGLDADYGAGTTEKILRVINENRELVKGLVYEKRGDGWALIEAQEGITGEYVVKTDTVEIASEAFKNCTKLEKVTLPDGSNTSLGDRCFVGCSALREVELLGSIPEWGEETFMGCTGIESVKIGSGSSDKIAKIGNRAFKGCTGLSDPVSALTFRATVTELGEECFSGCENIAQVAITSAFQKNLEIIGDRAFENCKNLYLFQNSKYSGLKHIGAYAFKNCDSMEGPSIPAGVQTIGEGCFEDCDNLKTVSFYGPLEEYPKDCFKNCRNLTRTGGTAAALTGLKRIGEGAYEGCTSLTTNESWYLGKYTGLEKIGANAFRGCTNISYVDLAASVNEIGAGAFDGCVGIGKDGETGTLTLNTILSGKEPPEITIGMIDLNTLTPTTETGGFHILVPDSEGDSVYQAYLKLFTDMFGADKAYAVLNTPDDAKSRHSQTASIALMRGDVSGNDVSGNDVSGNDAPGDDASGNDVSGNDLSGNDTAAKDVFGNNVLEDAVLPEESLPDIVPSDNSGSESNHKE